MIELDLNIDGTVHRVTTCAFSFSPAADNPTKKIMNLMKRTPITNQFIYNNIQYTPNPHKTKVAAANIHIFFNSQIIRRKEREID